MNLKRMISSMLSVGLLAVVANFVVAGREISTANFFGTSSELDAFILALMVPLFVSNVFGGALSVALMPSYIKLCSQKKQQAATQLLNSAMCLIFVMLLGLSLLLWLILEPVLALISYNYDRETIIKATELSSWLIPILLITGLTQLYVLVLNAHQRFILSALTPVIAPLITILLLLGYRGSNIELLAVGLVSGVTIELVILGTVGWKKFSIAPLWFGVTDILINVSSAYKTMILSGLLMGSTLLVDQAMAATLGSGSVATLNYANKLSGFFLAVFSIALSTVVLPHFSRLIAEQRWLETLQTFRKMIILILLATLPLVVMLCYFSEWIIISIFQRGLFSEQDSSLVGDVQSVLVLQIPFYLLSTLSVRLLTAMGKGRVLMKLSAMNLLLNIVGNYLLMQTYGLTGIAFSTVIVYAFSFVVILIYLRNLKNVPFHS